MAVSTTTALVASALISAGAAGIQGAQSRKQAKGQAAHQSRLAKRKRIAEVAAQEAESKRARDARAVEQAAATGLREEQLKTQGISPDFGDLDVGALGATSGDTAASTLNPIKPDTRG